MIIRTKSKLVLEQSKQTSKMDQRALKLYKSALQYNSKSLNVTPQSNRKSNSPLLDSVIEGSDSDRQSKKGILNHNQAQTRTPSKYDQSLQFYDQAIQRDPQNKENYNNKGNTFQDQQKYILAIECYEKALDIDQKYTSAIYNMGTAYYYLTQLNKAQECYEQVIQINQNHIPSLIGQGNKIFLIIFFIKKKGYIYEQQQLITTAKELYKKILNFQPNNRIALFNLGNINYDQNDFENAISCYQQLLQLEPDHINALNNKGVTYYSLELFDDAQKCFDQILMTHPQFKLAYFNKGLVMEETQDFYQAEQCYNSTIYFDPNFSLAFQNRGNVYLQLNKLNEAIESYKKALDIDPRLTDVLVNLGNIYREQRCYEQAIEYYERATQINPFLIDPINYKGIALEELKEYNLALECYDKVLILNSHDKEIYNNKGNCFQELGQLQEAIQQYELAIQIDPCYANAYYNSAVAYYQLEDYDKVIEYCQLALKYDLSFVDAFNFIGNSYRKKKQYGLALDNYQQALELCPNHPLYLVNAAKVNFIINEYQKALNQLQKAQFELLNPNNDFKFSQDIVNFIQSEIQQISYIEQQILELQDKVQYIQDDQRTTILSQLNEIQSRRSELYQQTYDNDESKQGTKGMINNILDELSQQKSQVTRILNCSPIQIETEGSASNVQVQELNQIVQSLDQLFSQPNGHRIEAYFKAYFWILSNYMNCYIQVNQGKIIGGYEKFISAQRGQGQVLQISEFCQGITGGSHFDGYSLLIIEMCLHLIHHNHLKNNFQTRIQQIYQLYQQKTQGTNDLELIIARSGLRLCQLKSDEIIQYDKQTNELSRYIGKNLKSLFGEYYLLNNKYAALGVEDGIKAIKFYYSNIQYICFSFQSLDIQTVNYIQMYSDNIVSPPSSPKQENISRQCCQIF